VALSAGVSSGKHRALDIPTPTGYADCATSKYRGCCSRFRAIKAYWIMISPRLAQIALSFGANDLDGTVVEERLSNDAGAKTSEFTPRQNSHASSAPRPRACRRDTSITRRPLELPDPPPRGRTSSPYLNV